MSEKIDPKTNKPRIGAKTIKMCLKQIKSVNKTEPINN